MNGQRTGRWRFFGVRAGLLAALGVVVLLQSGGCYYVQAVNGQLELLRKREPIEEVVKDADLDDEIRRRLAMVLEVRQFAVDELRLPDNDSYKTYVDLGRDYVVWNVFAAPEFSLEPRTWCFPVVGCVAYRGYFAESAARRHAEKLDAEGFDVYVGGVPAYSTLGRFDDPVLNTMLRWSDADLVATVFHELAHQRLFVKGDTGFNESFATAVGEAGLARWLEAQGREGELDAYERRGELRETMTRIVDEARAQLAALYAEPNDPEVTRERKAALMEQLVERAEQAAAEAGFAGSGWLRPPLNNARLLPFALYRGHVDAFRALLTECSDDFECFYAAAESLADLEPEARSRRLEALASSTGRDAR